MSKTGWFYAANVAQLTLRFVQMILVTRLLTGTELGVYYAAAAYPQLFSRVIDFGLPHAVRYYMLQHPSSGRVMLSLIGRFVLIVTVPVLLVFYFVERLPLESPHISAGLQKNFVILALYCIFLTVNSILLSIVISFERFKAILLANTIPFIIFIVLTVSEYYFHELTSDDVLMQLLISETATLTIYFSAILLSGNLKAGQDSIEIRNVLRYSIQIYPSGFLKVLTTRLDKVILSFLAPPVFIGYYSVLMTIRDTSIFPISTYGQMFMNKLSKAFAEGREAITRDINRNLIAVFIAFVLGFIVYLVLQELILRLFFREVTPELMKVAPYLLVSTVPLALISFLSNVFLATNRPRFVSYSSVLTILVFYGFVFAGFETLGVQTFFFASVLSTSIGFLYLLLVYIRTQFQVKSI